MTAFDDMFSGDSEDDELDFNSLPFPKPIPKRAFVSPDFNPDEFLSTSHRHQTLRDIQSELRLRAQSLKNELVELVNRDYEDFVGLGGSLKGGEEKIDRVIKELESFIKDARGLSDRAWSNLKVMDEKMEEKRRLKDERDLFRGFLFLLQHIEEMEMLLESRNLHILDPKPTFVSTVVSSNMRSTSRLRHSASKYLLIQQIVAGLSHNLPISQFQLSRLSTLRCNLSAQLKMSIQDAILGNEGDIILQLLKVYRMLDENPTSTIKKFINS
ncbi:Conserved oligomeric Golgi complex subunit 2 [Neolecta irregularis DAH-3]|uniref:Conserved oligomeric Golgi complex subunit 2 n=1 Tax=Neolecta irregularis (strain DAH-3) TaxID=1198029 RepID=A0A1U7LGV5_NEOID|nr:Conserved oligomeric Golgi complex subunit 2 [Neolecta irregularis DAH-3]|eukprot:OLL21782.1 Conserved oligomeric Golgi complex subunit 2 [Neolecta irregularis DAH-3]